MRNIYFILLISLVSISAVAQKSVFRGKITDKDQNLALPGAAIFLTELQRGAVADATGSFVITNLPAGKHQVRISYLGYETLTQTVELADNATTLLNLSLKAGVIEGQEVIVMGDRLIGQAKALNQQKNNVNITNIVAADQIGRFPDANIGDALKRIPGITVQNDQGEARYGLIRGTEARLNSVMLNGERLPSAEANIRNVQLDLIPADMIQNIAVNKALTPDMDADAIGGAINLETRSAPNKFRASATIGSGYTPISGKPIYQGSAIIAQRFFNNKLGVVASGNYQNVNYGSDNVEVVWNKTSAADGSQIFINDLQIREYKVQRIRRSGSLSLDYNLGKNSRLTLRTMLNRRDDYENRFRLRLRPDQGTALRGPSGTSYRGLPDAAGVVKGARVEVETKGGADDVKNARLERQTTYSTTLAGEHLLANTLNVKWSLTHAYASEDRPGEYYMTFRMPATDVRVNLADPEFPTVTPVAPLNYSGASFRPFQVRNDFTDERDLNGRLDLLLPLTKSGDFSNSLKFGGRFRTKKKDSAPLRGNFVLPAGRTVRWVDVETKDYTESDYYAGEGKVDYAVGQFATPESLGRFQSQFGATYVDAPVDYAGNVFNAGENIYSGYAMLNQNLGKKLFALAGLRLENTKVDYTANVLRFNASGALTSVTPQSDTKQYTNVMPHLHLKYDLDETTVLRLAWTNSLARPNYIDLAPRRNVNIEELSEGNPDLKATTSMNFDLMAERYFKNVGIISAGIFHKNINNFIYQNTILNYLDPVSGQQFLRYLQPRNGSEARLTGVEVAFQRQIFKGFGVYVNYTYNDSKVINLPGRENDDVPLPGTAKHNLNASLSYETKKLVLRVSYNYHSEFIDPEETSFTSDRFFDRYQDRMEQLDFNGSYAFTTKLRVFGEANNLTNQPLRFFQGARAYTMQAEYYGPRFSFGLKYDW